MKLRGFGVCQIWQYYAALPEDIAVTWEKNG